MKISVFITAHILTEPCNEDSMVLFASDYEREGFLSSDTKSPFLKFLEHNFPLFKWDYDDGDDTYNTGYCQYAAYTEDETMNYVLATLEVFE